MLQFLTATEARTHYLQQSGVDVTDLGTVVDAAMDATVVFMRQRNAALCDSACSKIDFGTPATDRLEGVTRIACAACGALKDAGMLEGLKESTRKWYEVHQQIDQHIANGDITDD
jgi:hypothetical protein